MSKRSKFFYLKFIKEREEPYRLRLSRLCFHCAHVRWTLDKERALSFGTPKRAMHTISCTQGLLFPLHNGRCPGFTPAPKKTKGNRRTREATKALPFDALCSIVRAPRNNTRLHKGLSGSPRFGRTLVTAFAVYACRFCGQVLTHIGQICNVRGPARARRSRVDRGALQICPFLFPEQHEVFNV